MRPIALLQIQSVKYVVNRTKMSPTCITTIATFIKSSGVKCVEKSLLGEMLCSNTRETLMPLIKTTFVISVAKVSNYEVT